MKVQKVIVKKYVDNIERSDRIHLQSTIIIVGDKVVGGLPAAADPDNLTSSPFSGKT